MGRKMTGWLTLALALLFLSGCSGILSGILLEKKLDDGSADRLRVDSMDVDAWKHWQHKRTNKYDEMGVVLKKETTF
jgi:hypothetical protein